MAQQNSLKVMQGTKTLADSLIRSGNISGFTVETLIGEVARNISVPRGGAIEDRDIMSMLVTARETGLSPVDGSLYGFKTTTGGLIKAISYAGWQNIVCSHPLFSGLKWEFGETMRAGNNVYFDQITCWIKRKDCELPIGMPVFWTECAPPRRTEGSPWNTQPRHMHMVRAFTTSAKLAFGIKGKLYTIDEAIQASGNTSIHSVDEEGFEEEAGIREHDSGVLRTIKNVHDITGAVPLTEAMDAIPVTAEEKE